MYKLTFTILIALFSCIRAGEKNERIISNMAPRSHVYSINEENGFLWFGTACGAVRYNQVNADITVYGEEEGLTGNYVFDVEFDDQGQAFAATNVGIYCLKNGKWEQFVSSDSLPSHYITCITRRADGAMWFGTAQGICVFDGGKWIKYTIDNSGIASQFINELKFDAQGHLWIGGRHCLTEHFDDRWINYGFATSYPVLDLVMKDELVIMTTPLGVHIKDGNRWTTLEQTSGLSSKNVKAIAVSPDDNIFLGGQLGLITGLFKAGAISNQKKIETHAAVEDLFIDSANRAWIATEAGVIYQGEDREWRTLDISNGLKKDKIVTLASDGAALWTGAKNGLSIIWNNSCSPAKWENGGELLSTSVIAITDDTVYIAADSCIGIIDQDQVKKIASLNSSSLGYPITQIRRHENALYCSSSKGIAALKGDAWETITNEYDVRDFIFYHNALWLATSSGAIEITDQKPVQHLSKYTQLSSVDVDQAGKLWFGGQEGFYQLKGSVKKIDEITDLNVLGFKIAPNGEIYGYTAERAFCIDGKKNVNSLGLLDGLVSDEISAISIDKNGTIWMGSPDGISRIQIVR